MKLYIFSGGRTGPVPTPPNPTPPTAEPTEPTDPTEPTTTTTVVPVDPTKDACKQDTFDTITVIQGELHFFKDGWAAYSSYFIAFFFSKQVKTRFPSTWNVKFCVSIL